MHVNTDISDCLSNRILLPLDNHFPCIQSLNEARLHFKTILTFLLTKKHMSVFIKMPNYSFKQHLVPQQRLGNIDLKPLERLKSVVVKNTFPQGVKWTIAWLWPSLKQISGANIQPVGLRRGYLPSWCWVKVQLSVRGKLLRQTSIISQ